jgi:hypothetical protein
MILLNRYGNLILKGFHNTGRCMYGCTRVLLIPYVSSWPYGDSIGYQRLCALYLMLIVLVCILGRRFCYFYCLTSIASISCVSQCMCLGVIDIVLRCRDRLCVSTGARHAHQYVRDLKGVLWRGCQAQPNLSGHGRWLHLCE